MKPRQQEQRNAIIDAAFRAVYREGYANTTIDVIAAEAGMSKGGVFYYFKNKNEIFHCAIDRYEEIFNTRRAEILAALPEGRGRLLRATVLASLENYDQNKDHIHNLIGLYTDTAFTKKIAELKRRQFAELAQDCARPERLAMIMLFLDGQWMDRTMGETAIPAHDHQKVRDEFMRYVDETAEGCP